MVCSFLVGSWVSVQAVAKSDGHIGKSQIKRIGTLLPGR